MSIQPVVGQLITPASTTYQGDFVGALLTGDPLVVISISGTFVGASFIVEGIPLLSSLSTWTAIPQVRSDAGQSLGGTVGPVNGYGAGGALVMTLDGGLYQGVRVRLASLTTGPVTVSIVSIPLGASGSVAVVAGNVNVAGGQVNALQQVLGPSGLPLPQAGDNDGALVQDNRVCALLDAVLDQLKKQTLLLLYIAGENAEDGATPLEFLAENGVEVDATDIVEMLDPIPIDDPV